MKLTRLLLLAAWALACSFGPVDAQGIGLGYVHFTSAQLTSAISIGAPAGTSFALITCSAQTVNWRDDGVAPTAAIGGGMPLTSGVYMNYSGSFGRMQLIETAGGATCDVTFYRF